MWEFTSVNGWHVVNAWGARPEGGADRHTTHAAKPQPAVAFPCRATCYTALRSRKSLIRFGKPYKYSNKKSMNLPMSFASFGVVGAWSGFG